MVPEGWVKAKYSDGIQLLSGQHINACEANERGDGTPYLTGPADFPNGRIEVTKYTSKPKTVCKAGDILLTVKGSGAGKSIIANSCYCISRQLMAIRAIKFDPAFTYYSITSLTNSFERAAAGLIPGISRSDVLNSIILLPPLPEQKKIARILSTWDKAIETVDKLIENSKQQKKALMQQLLSGKKRLPGFSGEWKEVRLGKVATINPKKSARPEDGLVSFVPMEAVSETAQLLSLETKKYEEVSKGFSAFSDGDVLVAKITPCFENGKGAYVTNLTNGVGFGSTEFHVIRTEEELFSRFIYYITNSYEFRFRGEANMQGSAGQRRVPTDFLRAYPIALPPIDEQKAICSVLDTVSLTIDKLSNKKELFTHAKQALMQQLLTGKRRVTVGEHFS